MSRRSDFVIIGAGIVGLALARELRTRHPRASIVVLEKEPQPGAHASGRNSGVLHSGIYYEPGTVKAALCRSGAEQLRAYVCERNLPLAGIGKVIVPTSMEEDAALDGLLTRGRANGVQIELIDEAQLRALEPAARTASGRALWIASTAVVEPRAVLQALAADLQDVDVTVETGVAVRNIDESAGRLRTSGNDIAFGHCFNAAGLHADVMARQCGIAGHYRILPFRGLYHALAPDASVRVRRLIYPVPDLRVPFLGVHFTPSTSGRVYVGPTAIPALGRENYRRLTGLAPADVLAIGRTMARLLLRNEQGFRRLALREARHLLGASMVASARRLVPELRPDDLVATGKVGIRAQLIDTRTHTLIMDFVVEQSARTTHVLNAVSPGFTSAFAFARHVIEQSPGSG